MKLLLKLAFLLLLSTPCANGWSDENATSENATSETTAAANEAVVLEISEAQVSLIQNAFVATPMSGVVAKVDVSEGDKVDVGSRLVLLRDDQARTELQAAKAAYEAARLIGANDIDKRYAQRTLEVHEREYQQSQIANRNFKGTISETELEKLRLVVDQSQLAIAQAEHELLVARATAAEKQATVQMAQERLKKHGVETMVSGLVTEIDVQPGEWVEAGKPIVRVISVDPMRIECFVDGKKHGSELVGHPVRFMTADADKNAANGEVTFVSPELHPVTGQVRLWATVANPKQQLRAGMQGRLVIDAK